MANAYEIIDHAEYALDRGDINLAEYEAIIRPWRDAEPVKYGRWEPFDLTWGRSVYACSHCREAFEVPTEGGKPIYNRCPNCGAIMDESAIGQIKSNGRENCPYRHENGNCLPVGGFCLAVADEYCPKAAESTMSQVKPTEGVNEK